MERSVEYELLFEVFAFIMGFACYICKAAAICRVFAPFSDDNKHAEVLFLYF